MAYSLSVATLLTRCLQRANRENDGSIQPAEAQSLLSEVYGELHGEVASTGLRYFESEADITATGAAHYALPSDHLSTLGVERVIDSAGHRRPLIEVMAQQRARLLGRTGDATAYAVVGQYIELYPNPASGPYKLVYVPQPTDLSIVSTSTPVDVVTADGLAFCLWAFAVKAIGPKEDDVQVAMMEREAARERLRAWAINRHMLNSRKLIVGRDDYEDDD